MRSTRAGQPGIRAPGRLREEGRHQGRQEALRGHQPPPHPHSTSMAAQDQISPVSEYSPHLAATGTLWSCSSASPTGETSSSSAARHLRSSRNQRGALTRLPMSTQTNAASGGGRDGGGRHSHPHAGGKVLAVAGHMGPAPMLMRAGHKLQNTIFYPDPT